MKIELKRCYDEGIRNDKLVDDAFMGFEINLIPENEEEINWFRSKSAHIENFYNRDGGHTILYNEEESEIDEPKPPKNDHIIVWKEIKSEEESEIDEPKPPKMAKKTIYELFDESKIIEKTKIEDLKWNGDYTRFFGENNIEYNKRNAFIQQAKGNTISVYIWSNGNYKFYRDE